MNFLGLLLVALDTTILMGNFVLKRESFYGRYPMVFAITKMLIIPFIFLHLYLNMDSVPLLVGLFTLFSGIGDILLLGRQFLHNVTGCFSFFLAHSSLIKYYDNVFVKPSWVAIAFCLPQMFLLFGYLGKIILKKPQYSAGFLYLGILSLGLLSAFNRYYVYGLSLTFFCAYLGQTIFIISDTALFAGIFLDVETAHNILVLPTYILALVLISTGVILGEKRFEVIN
ncbi:hypothetical protein GPJ56_007342 [Histomonas meleagridis]|uniref:uncharacterized protein n=1 Tax=Histomonas meleagridis TaxID=135588 RepID=UPI003559F9DC|nr:hypothetical protein GPJ56_007342 [Histomonas meleagridis]KAH0804188.1 hypothetical protein GO595_003018 [Histomonas meleagridis]